MTHDAAQPCVDKGVLQIAYRDGAPGPRRSGRKGECIPSVPESLREACGASAPQDPRNLAARSSEVTQVRHDAQRPDLVEAVVGEWKGVGGPNCKACRRIIGRPVTRGVHESFHDVEAGDPASDEPSETARRSADARSEVEDAVVGRGVREAGYGVDHLGRPGPVVVVGVMQLSTVGIEVRPPESFARGATGCLGMGQAGFAGFRSNSRTRAW